MTSSLDYLVSSYEKVLVEELKTFDEESNKFASLYISIDSSARTDKNLTSAPIGAFKVELNAF